MTYDGGKNGAGMYQTIINQMPPHLVYIEAFLGSGAIMRRKRRAQVNIGLEIDPAICARVKPELSAVHVICTDALQWLPKFPLIKETLIYADPPYLMSTRSCQRDLYRFEFGAEADHVRLLELARSIPAMWIISGYQNELYDHILCDWRRVDYQGMTRRGPVTESLWCNFPDPVALHDYTFLGRDNTDRQRIKRKIGTWKDRLLRMPALERQAILEAIHQ